MGHKIFVSYKYSDNNVYQISKNIYQHDTVRTYVDKLEQYIDNTDNIYKGESDNEDLSRLSEDTIWGKLKDRIYSCYDITEYERKQERHRTMDSVGNIIFIERSC